MLSIIPIPIIANDITTTGSAVVDVLASFAIALYDLLNL